MKKTIVVSSILFLILFTVIIKNSTKRVDDQIFSMKEGVGVLKKEYETIKLEHDYLSSAERLLKFQDLYFDNELVKKNIQNFHIIEQNSNKLLIKQLKFFNE
ncbi:cell division protein FtsL [Candidatus Pelagibacter sp.]|nr:cell division protein FtsL [Candidatus Pelagibacter sp.]